MKLADGKRRGKGSPAEAWKSTDVGLDSDLWLQAYRRHLRPHASPAESDAFYSRIFLESPAATLIVTPEFNIADANIAAQKLFKRTLAELRDFPFVVHVASMDQAGFSVIRTVLKEPEGRVVRPLKLRLHRDIEQDVLLLASAFRNDDGEIEFVQLVLVELGTTVLEDFL